MKRFVLWVLAQRHRSVVLAVVAAPLLPIVTAALTGLGTARNGVRQGLVGAVVGVAALVLLGLAARADIATFATMGVLSFGAGVALGALVRRTGNLGLAFQSTVLFCLVAVLVLSLGWPDLHTGLDTAVAEVAEAVRSGGGDDAQVAMIERLGGIMLLATFMFLQLLGALLLAYWWLTLASAERRFAGEFRRLKLGRLLGGVATVLLALGLVFDAELVQNLLPLAMLAFVVQGLAVVHAWAHAKRWHPALVAPVYILLVTPPTAVLAVLALSAIGLVDNWFDLRATLRTQA